MTRILLMLIALTSPFCLMAEEVPASLRWAEVSTLSTPLSGRIGAIKVKAGDRVKKNALLASLDPRPYQAKIKRSRAEVKRLKARYQDIKREFDRARELYDRTVLSTTDLQSAETRFDIAAASLERAQADLELARLDLEYSQIRAPFDGVITAREIESGETVTNQCSITPMIRIARTNRLLATAKITPAQAERLAVAQQMAVITGGQRFQGTITAIKATPGNHSLLELSIIFASNGKLEQGEKAVIEIDTPK